MTATVSRREFVVRSGALLGGTAVFGSAVAGRAAAAAQGAGDPDAPAAAAGTLRIGGDLRVNRCGFGAMRLTGDEQWGPPADMNEARSVLRRAVCPYPEPRVSPIWKTTWARPRSN